MAESEYCTTESDTMAWFRDTYGIELVPSETDLGGYNPNVNIVDEQKYMIFL